MSKLTQKEVSFLARIFGEPCSTCTNYTKSFLSFATKEEMETESKISKNSKCEVCQGYCFYFPTDGITEKINNYLEIIEKQDKKMIETEPVIKNIEKKEETEQTPIETKKKRDFSIKKALVGDLLYNISGLINLDVDIKEYVNPNNKKAEMALKRYNEQSFYDDDQEDEFMNMTLGIID